MPLLSANGKKLSPAEIRMNDLTVGLLLQRFQAVIFSYSPADDTLILKTAPDTGGPVTLKVSHFAASHYQVAPSDLEIMPQLLMISSHFRYMMNHSPEGVLDCAEETSGIWFHLYYLHRQDDSGSDLVVGFLSTAREAESSRRELNTAASRHPITKLPLTDATSALVDQAISRLSPGEKGVIFYFDLSDYPKLIREHGLSAAESYIRQLADVLRTDFRSGDIIGQIADDRFVIFFNGYFTIDVIESRAQHLINLFRKVRTELISPVACNLGVAVTGSNGIGFSQLLPKAAHSLEIAKRRGQNRYCMFDE